ncbi:MAG: DEAD/DEAH box helicase [Candidatus Kaiserbacteria bacterium]|nr:MAG: DEAD/DEAH box helicase [Candidatus Kaiserbacteria bacterium]
MNSSLAPEGAPTFYHLGIAPNVLAVLERLRFTTPTPIQHQAIPLAIEGKDIVGIAQTGTGKTLAFGVPTIQHILATGGTGLVLLPTRELALQVEETFHKVGQPLGIKTALLIGGASMGPQLAALKRNPDVVIATPGRLIDHLDSGTIRLGGVSILILDEADRMLDMGFLPQIRRILAALTPERQTMLFSATLSPEIMTIATKTMRLPLRIEVAPSGTTAERVTQEFFMVRKDEKPRLLEKILSEYRGSTLVFTRTKHGAKKITRVVRSLGHEAAEIHGNRSLNQRREALEGFKTGKYRVLVATDIAARGIDVRGIELVINYDLPMQAADYVHRIGRTGRAGAEGHAISFALPDERRDIRDIERLVRKSVPISHLPELPPARQVVQEREHAPRQLGRRGPSRPRRSFGRSRPSGRRPQW